MGESKRIQLGKLNYTFKFKQLPELFLEKIFQYLDAEVKVELLLCNKDCHQLFLPILWKDLDIRKNYYDNSIMGDSYKKCGKYIKDLFIFNVQTGIVREFFRMNTRPIEFVKGNLNTEWWPNAVNLHTNLKLYLMNEPILSHLKLESLLYDLTSVRLYDNEWFLSRISNESRSRELFKDLKKIEIKCLDEYFINNVLKLLPLTIDTFKVLTNLQFSFLNQIFNILPNIKELNFSNYRFDQDDLDYFNSNIFTHLIKLSLSKPGRDSEDLVINFEHLPNLKQLSLEKFKSIQFINKSNLHSMSLIDLPVEGDQIPISQFDSLKKLEYSHYIVSDLIFSSFFNLPKLTYLKVSISGRFFYTIKKIETISRSPLITLEFKKMHLEPYLFSYIFSSCSNLSNILLKDCSYDQEKLDNITPKGSGIFIADI